MQSKQLAEQFRAIAKHLLFDLNRNLSSDRLKAAIQYQQRDAQRLLHSNRTRLGLEIVRLSDYLEQVCNRLDIEERKELSLTTAFMNCETWESGRREVTDEMTIVTHLAGYSQWLADLLQQYADTVGKPGPFDHKTPIESFVAWKAKYPEECTSQNRISLPAIQIAQPDKEKGSGGRHEEELSDDEISCITSWLDGIRYREIDSAMLGRAKQAYYGEKKWTAGDAEKVIRKAKERGRRNRDNSTHALVKIGSKWVLNVTN